MQLEALRLAVQAESAPAPVRQVNCSPQVSTDPFSCVLNASASGEGGPFRPESHRQGNVSLLNPKIKQSNARMQDDGAFAEAVTKSKSKKERGQNKAVLDVADLFAGQSLGLLNRTVFVFFWRLFSFSLGLCVAGLTPHFQLVLPMPPAPPAPPSAPLVVALKVPSLSSLHQCLSYIFTLVHQAASPAVAAVAGESGQLGCRAVAPLTSLQRRRTRWPWRPRRQQVR